MKSEFAKLPPDTGVESCQSSSFVQTLTVAQSHCSSCSVFWHFRMRPNFQPPTRTIQKKLRVVKTPPTCKLSLLLLCFLPLSNQTPFPTISNLGWTKIWESCQNSSNVRTVTAPSLFSRTFLRNPIPFLLSCIILAPINQLLNLKCSTAILVLCSQIALYVIVVWYIIQRSVTNIQSITENGHRLLTHSVKSHESSRYTHPVHSNKLFKSK